MYCFFVSPFHAGDYERLFDEIGFERVFAGEKEGF